MEQRGGPKALTVGIWTGLKDKAHSRMGAESGRQERGGGGGSTGEREDPALVGVPAPVFRKEQASFTVGCVLAHNPDAWEAVPTRSSLMPPWRGALNLPISQEGTEAQRWRKQLAQSHPVKGTGAELHARGGR